MVEQVVKALTGNGTVMPKNWNRRFKHNRDKMKTGDIFELAEVVRNLSLRDHEKGLSTGEKQMFVKAKKILSSELMYAKDMDEEEAALWLEDVLSGVGIKKTKKKAKVGAGAVKEGLAKYGLCRQAAPRGSMRRPQSTPVLPIRTRPAALPGATRSALTTSSIPPNPHSPGVWAVIVAAGRGERLGTEHPKRSPSSAGDHCWPRAWNGSTKRVDRGDRRRRSRRVGGAGDPARRGARLFEGQLVRGRRRDAR